MFRFSLSIFTVSQGHLNTITALTTSHSKQFIASGDTHKALVWDSNTFEVIFSPPEARNLSVAALAFSNSDRYLMIILADDFYTMIIYDWQSKLLISKTYLGIEPIYFCGFSHELSPNAESTYAITVGKSHLRFWKCLDSNFIYCIDPDLQDLNSSPTFLCCIIFQEKAIAGNDDGYLVVFQDFSLKQKVKAHTGAVTAISNHQGSRTMYSAGQDGFVRLWNDSFECIKEINVESFSKSTTTACKAVAASPDSSHLTVGTFGAEIFEVEIRRGNITNDLSCYKGHTGQLSGLAVHPSQTTFVTASDDSTLR